jgi:uncharacterized protein YecE (DUF72 family)
MPLMQDALFPDSESPVPSAPASGAAPARRPARAPVQRRADVEAATSDDALSALALELPAGLHLGTSSWTFPGWRDLVWRDSYSESQLARRGLPAYARHPLLRTVSLDRAFYRPLTTTQYAQLAAQVPDGFRFIVKAPSLVSDALVRGPEGRGLQTNDAFLDPALALSEFVQPAIDGLGARLGALVIQISPLPARWLAPPEAFFDRLDSLLRALPRPAERVAGAVLAVEVRDATLLQPRLAEVLRAHGATYCLGLHARLPPIEAQLPMLRALWPGPLVCRWNLHRKHGAHGYESAKADYAPFDRLIDEDLETRQVLARVIAGTTRAGHAAYVSINNKAEGSAPLSVLRLAESVAASMRQPRPSVSPGGPDATAAPGA